VPPEPGEAGFSFVGAGGVCKMPLQITSLGFNRESQSHREDFPTTHLNC